MRAVVLEGPGGPDELNTSADVPRPTPNPGEALVRVHTAALNRRDLFLSYGQYPGIRVPCILGSDAVGEVVEMEDRGGSWPAGDVVLDPTLGWGQDDRAPSDAGISLLGMPQDGTLAEYIALPAANVHAKPSHLSRDEAAALPMAGVTAYRAVVSRGRVMSGETVIVPGVGGGVASLCVQIAVALGARVYVTSGSDEKLETARTLGAEGGVNYRSNNWPKDLHAMAGPADVVLDTIGGTQFNSLLRMIRIGGRAVSIGATAGPVPELLLPRVFLKHIDILGTATGSPRDFTAMLDFVTTHDIRPVIAERFDLDETSRALRMMESTVGFGKILIQVSR